MTSVPCRYGGKGRECCAETKFRVFCEVMAVGTNWGCFVAHLK